MLSSIAIIKAAERKVAGKLLSPQAVAVVEAIVESINTNSLVVTRQEEFPEVKEKLPRGKFRKPTGSEVIGHGVKIGLSEAECQKFYDYYESNGWRVGRNPMKNWRSAMANWKRNVDETASEPEKLTPAEMILKQKALERVEARLIYIRGQKPPNGWKSTDALFQELQLLKGERTLLMGILSLKA